MTGFMPFVKSFEIAVKRFFEEKYTYRASALAFTTLLAIVPLLLVIVFFIAIFPFFSNIVQLGESYILVNFVPSSATSIQYYFRGFIQQSTHLSVMSLLFLFIAAIMLVHTIEETLNDIWKVPRRKRSKKILALLLHCLIILLIPFIIGFSIFLSSYFFLVSWIIGVSERSMFPGSFLSWLPVGINTAIFTLLYVIVPNIKVHLRDGLLGGFVAAILFELARIGFAVYAEQFPEYALIYGAFAIIPIFLIWLYIFWFIILLGALIAYSKGHMSKEKKSEAT